MIDQWDALLTFALHHGIWELHSSNEISQRKVLLLVACSVSRDWGSFRYCHLIPWLESGLQGTMLSYKPFKGNIVKHSRMKGNKIPFHSWLGDIVDKFRHVYQCLVSHSFYFSGNSWCLMHWTWDNIITTELLSPHIPSMLALTLWQLCWTIGVLQVS